MGFPWVFHWFVAPGLPKEPPRHSQVHGWLVGGILHAQAETVAPGRQVLVANVEKLGFPGDYFSDVLRFSELF